MHSILIVQGMYVLSDESHILPLRSRLLTHGKSIMKTKEHSGVLALQYGKSLSLSDWRYICSVSRHAVVLTWTQC
jgi:hypothetical protein